MPHIYDNAPPDLNPNTMGFDQIPRPTAGYGQHQPQQNDTMTFAGQAVPPGGFSINYGDANWPQQEQTAGVAPLPNTPAAVPPIQPQAPSDPQVAFQERMNTSANNAVSAYQRQQEFQDRYLSGANDINNASGEYDSYLRGEKFPFEMQSPAARRAAGEHWQAGGQQAWHDRQRLQASAQARERASTPSQALGGMTPNDWLAAQPKAAPRTAQDIAASREAAKLRGDKRKEDQKAYLQKNFGVDNVRDAVRVRAEQRKAGQQSAPVYMPETLDRGRGGGSAQDEQMAANQQANQAMLDYYKDKLPKGADGALQPSTGLSPTEFRQRMESMLPSKSKEKIPSYNEIFPFIEWPKDNTDFVLPDDPAQRDALIKSGVKGWRKYQESFKDAGGADQQAQSQATPSPTDDVLGIYP